MARYRELAVHALTERAGVSQPAVSKHLGTGRSERQYRHQIAWSGGDYNRAVTESIMSIQVEGFSCESGTWKRIDSPGSQGKNSRAEDHAERMVLSLLQGKNKRPPYLLVQNAFPCKICHTFFKGQKSAVVIKIVADEGKYSRDVKEKEMPELVGDLSVPRIFYYFDGKCKMVGMSSRGADAAPPASFPDHPDFSHL